MHGTVVGVLRGGPSREHEVSLRSGHAVMDALAPERYTVRDIYIDREGVWHERGLRTTPAGVLPGMDVAVIALHGEYAVDGEVQKVLERYGVPYTGSDSFASFIAMHRVFAKEKAKSLGMQTPRYTLIETAEDATPAVHTVIRTYPQPVVVKPVRYGSSVGVTAPAGYQPVHQAVTGLLNEASGGAIVEEYVRGSVAAVTVIEKMRGEDLYVLPIAQIVPHAEGTQRAPIPPQLTKPQITELQRLARLMHQELRLRHYSRSHFMITPKGILYLSTNSLPELGSDSITASALASVGITFPDFIEHVIGLALNGERR